MRRLLLGVVVTVAACGSSSNPSNGDDVRTLNTAAQHVSTAVTAYATQASGMTDTAGCTAAETSYEGQVRPSIAQMQSMGPGMDQLMGSMGNAANADMTCAANAMMAELDHHHAVACASTTDMAPNKTEAQHHAAVMNDWAQHQEARSYAMGAMMGSGMGGMGMSGMAGNGTTTEHCVQNPDGSSSLQ